MNKNKLNNESVLKFKLESLSFFNGKQLYIEKEYKDLDSFVINLGLIYNDLKGLMTFWEILCEFAPDSPPKNKVSGRFGQYLGMKAQINKYMLSTLNEIIYFFKSNKNILNHNLFKKIINDKLGKEAKNSWKNLIEISLDEKLSNKDIINLKTIVCKIRNNGGFHYNQTKEIYKSYIHTFSNDQPSGKAYFSFGNSLYNSRFHFSDAAISKYLSTFITEETDSLIRKFIFSSHNGIFYFIIEYLKIRNIQVTKLNSDFDFEKINNEV